MRGPEGAPVQQRTGATRLVSGVGDLAADQQPVARGTRGHHRPLVVAVTFAAPPAGSGLPAPGGDEPGRGGGVLTAGGSGDLEVDRDREDVALPRFLAGRPEL